MTKATLIEQAPDAPTGGTAVLQRLGLGLGQYDKNAIHPHLSSATVIQSRRTIRDRHDHPVLNL